jgi:hypothetical protein
MSALSTTLESLDTTGLHALLDRAMADRPALRAQLAAVEPSLRRRARRTAERCAELVTGARA